MKLKIGYVVDSSSGLSKDAAKAKGFYFLPLVITINDHDYLDGDDLKANEYYRRITIKDSVKTSATPIGLVEKVITKAAKENDFVIVYPISEHLSSQFNNVEMVAKKMANVRVVASRAVAIIIEKEIARIQNFAKESNNINEIVKFANANVNNWNALVVPQTLEWLVKGGRVNASIATMASLMKIIPVIRFNQGVLEKESKGRIYRKTCIKAFKKMVRASEDKRIYVLIGGGDQEKAIYNEVRGLTNNVFLNYIPPIIANHCGPNSFIVLTKVK